VRFEDSFQVPVAVPAAWDTLTDIERVYPCLPGAELVEIADNEFHGLVTLKLGPITANYKGVARFDSLDRDAGKLVIHAEGRDRHGQGTAKARVYATLVSEGPEQTRVEMVNEIDITGKAAQFGRGVLTDVSKAMMAQFAANLRDVVTAPAATPNGHAEAAAGAPQAPASTPIDAVSLARSVAASRLQAASLRTAFTAGLPLFILLFILRRVLRRR
jgi:carbon monoxide dehydrogenase subunit G